MTPASAQLVTIAEYALYPEPRDRTDDLIDGVIVYRPLSKALHGIVCGNVAGAFGEYKRRAGGSASLRCGLVVSRDPDSVFGPDASYWRVRPASALDHGWPTIPPDAAFEVVDDGEPYPEVMDRVRRLIRFGIRLLWLVDPIGEHVIELRDGAMRGLGITDDLDGGDVLPGFSCKVADLFA